MRVKLAWMLCALALLNPMMGANAADESSEKVWVDPSHRGIKRYFSLHREEDHWWLEAFDVREGRLQRLVSKRAFDRQQDAIAEIQTRVPEAVEIRAQTAGPDSNSTPLTEVPGRVIWKVESAWDWSWELKYSDWVRDNVKADFFQKYQIGVDCADVAFSARWIFARIHHLPAANTLAATGALFTQESVLKEWENLSQAENWNEDRLFMVALRYVLDNTYTHTLMRDSYPISITQEALLPGVQHLNLTPDSGHTYVVSAVDLTENAADPIRVIYSTVPAESRRLLESGFWDVQQPTEGQGGFVRFRWPERAGARWMLRPAEQMSFYSNEQYSRTLMDGFASFAEAVAVKLNPHLDFKARLKNAVSTIIDRIHTRQSIVERGEKVCASEDCGEGTKNYENWSTPLRDQSLRETILSLEAYADQMGDRIPELLEIWTKSLEKPVIQLQGVDYPLGAVVFAWKMGSYSSDPKEPSAARWGLSGEAFKNSLKRQLEMDLEERSRKIEAQGENCMGTSTCHVGSPEWQAWQTFDLDAKIQTLALGGASYCDFAPKGECRGFEAGLDFDSLKIGARIMTLREWMGLSPWLNSDPARSKAERWGLLKTKYFYHLGDPGDVLVISKTGWMLSRASDQRSSPNLLNTLSGGRIVAPPGFGFTALDPETGLVAAEKPIRGGKEILVIDPDDQKVRWHKAVSSHTDVSWVLPSRLVLSGEHALRILDCSRSPCQNVIAESTWGKARPSDLSKPGVLLVRQRKDSYLLIDARTSPPSRLAFLWKESERYQPESISLETQEYFGGMAALLQPGGNVDRRQFFIRKSDGNVTTPFYSAGTEYLRYLSRNGQWGVLAQLYEANDQMTLVELDPDLKIKNRTPLGKEVEGALQRCRDSESEYFLSEDSQSRKQYYRLSDQGLAKAPLLFDEMEVKAGCREEMILRTASGERLRRWGMPASRFESAALEFLDPQADEAEIRWVLGSPISGARSSELFDLKSGSREPEMTGLLRPLEDVEEPNPSSARQGQLIWVGDDRLLWFRNID